jgi:hypothetical protein
MSAIATGRTRPLPGRAKRPRIVANQRFGFRIEVESCSVDSGQDGDRVIGQPTPGRCETYTPTIRLDQLLASHFGQRCDLLRHVDVVNPKASATFRI